MSVLRAIAVFLCGFFVMKSSNAQVLLPNMCPEIPVMQNFNVTRYMGKWYEAEKFFFIFQVGGKCTTAAYHLKENGAISVVNKHIGIFTGLTSEIRGEAKPVGKSGEAKLIVVFESVPVYFPAPYWVVDTDYDNYAVVWSCLEIGVFHIRNAWILTRARNPPKEIKEKTYSIVNRHGMGTEYLIKTDQTNCPKDSK